MRYVIVVALVVGAAVAGFIAGRLPESRRLTDAQTKLHAAEADISTARAMLRLHGLYDRIQALVEATSEPPRYEDALPLSTQFFDLVRTESVATADSGARTALSEVLASRDAVTAALAKHDPGVRALLVKIRETLHPLVEDGGSEGAPAEAAN
jgi:hypothetical protein